jgi:hypothetical protein
MKLLILALLMFVNSSNVKLENRIFIYEYYPKIKGQVIVGFISIEMGSSDVIDTSYKITYRDKSIRQVRRSSKTYRTNITETDSGIFIHAREITCYDSESFVRYAKYSKDFYSLLDKEFLEIDNGERYRVLEDIAKKVRK